MDKKIRIAIDAMGGENSPSKVIEGINISLKSNKDNFFYKINIYLQYFFLVNFHRPLRL